MNVAMHVRGAQALRANLGKLAAAGSGRNLATAARAGGLVVQNDAKVRAPKRTGNLARSIHLEVTESTKTRAVVTVGTDVEYAAAQEFGAVITPKSAKALHFQVGGKDVFAQVVHLPAHPYLRPALLENQDKVVAEVAAALKDLMKL